MAELCGLDVASTQDSRDTKLLDEELETGNNRSSQVVCDCLGNSESVAVKHYLQITEEHFQKAVQCLHEPPRNDSQPRLSHSSETQGIQFPASPCDSVNKREVAEAGLEPARSIRNSGF